MEMPTVRALLGSSSKGALGGWAAHVGAARTVARSERRRSSRAERKRRPLHRRGHLSGPSREGGGGDGLACEVCGLKLAKARLGCFGR